MKNKTVKSALLGLAGVALVSAWALTPTTAEAAGAGVKPPSQNWSFNGIFGTFDRASAQRGFQVYKEVCASCHGMNLIAYRHLQQIGFSKEQVKVLAAEATVIDGPNDEGEMFERPGRPSDTLPEPFENKKAAAAANNGKAPPDLSLITKARSGGGDSIVRFSIAQPGGFALGADYIYALLTGYDDPPEGFDVPDGVAYNTYFPGHIIAMANPLSEDAVEYTDGTKATVEQMAWDLSTFFAWAAEPELEERKRLGVKVMLFLLVLTGMLYALKRQVWSDQKH